MSDNNEFKMGFVSEDRPILDSMDKINAKLEEIQRTNQKVARSGKRGQEEFRRETDRASESLSRMEDFAVRAGRAITTAFAVEKVVEFINVINRVRDEEAKLRADQSRSLTKIVAQTGDQASINRISEELSGFKSPLTFQQRIDRFGAISAEAPGVSLDERLRLARISLEEGGAATGGRSGAAFGNRAFGFAADLLEKGGLSPEEAADIGFVISQEAGGADPRQVVEFAERFASAGGDRQRGIALGLAALRSGQKPEFLKTALSKIESNRDREGFERLRGQSAPSILQAGLAGLLTPEEKVLVFGDEGVGAANAFRGEEVSRITERIAGAQGAVAIAAEQQKQNKAVADTLFFETREARKDINIAAERGPRDRTFLNNMEIDALAESSGTLDRHMIEMNFKLAEIVNLLTGGLGTRIMQASSADAVFPDSEQPATRLEIEMSHPEGMEMSAQSVSP